jgi:hypothetical protein
MKLILLRCGQYENGHLNNQGRETMVLIADRLRRFIQNQKVQIISANIPRAFESAQIISEQLNWGSVQTLPELYAAEEDGHLPDLIIAGKVLSKIGKDADLTIAIVSREYAAFARLSFKYKSEN